MKLDEAQRQQVAAWIAQGLKLSEIQTRISRELGVSLTYMDVRLLVDDLKLTPKDPEPAKPATPLPGASPLASAAATAKAPRAAAPPKSDPEPAPEPAAGNVSVSVDQLARPGTVVSGKVTFTDGQKADWYLDQLGRLGLMPAQQGYKPSPADLQDFQLALQDELAKLGF
jgi:hypothetical protein